MTERVSERQLKGHGELFGKQVLQEKPSIGGLFCLRDSQFISLLMALPFFCVLIQEDFCCQKIKEVAHY